METQHRRTYPRVAPPRSGRSPSLVGLLFRISIWGIKGVVGAVGIWTIISLISLFF